MFIAFSYFMKLPFVVPHVVNGDVDPIMVVLFIGYQDWIRDNLQPSALKGVSQMLAP